MQDLTGQDIEIKISNDGKIVWVNTAEGCVLRACNINLLFLIDERKKTTDEDLAKQMASEMLLSDKPSVVIRNWRSRYKIHQKTLAQKMGISSSVICDYESGRRKSPGVALLKRLIYAIIDIKNGKEAKLQEVKSD